MRKLFFYCLLLLATLGNSQSELQIKVDVVYLSSDLLLGRETGTEGESLAAEYVADRFAHIGLTPIGTDGFFQPFTFEERPNPHAADPIKEPRTVHGKNVVGYLDKGSNQTIVIGAHYDHLGFGHTGSLYTGEPAIHNGADDNASGVAALLYLAESLKNNAALKENVLFIAFSGEEYGLFGSKYYAANPTISLDRVNYMMNMDMVGRLNKEHVLVVNGAGTSPVWKDLLEQEKGDLTIQTTDSGVGPSDHTSFYLEDMPVLHFFTGQHTDYHKPSDDSELINYEGIKDVSDYMIRLILSLDDQPKLAFTKTKDDSGKKASSFKVTLGVMPDYTYTAGDGMRIDGVLSDRPAEKAGMEKGDVIIRLGDVDVKDIYGYMDALGKFNSGDKTTIEYIRDGKKQTSEIVF